MSSKWIRGVSIALATVLCASAMAQTFKMADFEEVK
jgi:hypothetical protein